MEFEQQLRVAFAASDSRPELRSRILARASVLEGAKGKGGRAKRTILFGVILAFAAAAAMVAWSLKDESASPPAVTSITPAAAEPAPMSQEAQAVEQYRPVPKEAAKATDPQEILPTATPFNVLMLPLQETTLRTRLREPRSPRSSRRWPNICGPFRDWCCFQT
jgi:hypothetical protein